MPFVVNQRTLDTLRNQCHLSLMIDIASLSPQERLELIGRLWDSLDSDDIRLTPAQEAELDRRLSTFDEDIKAGSTWEQLDSELDRRYR